MFTLKTGSNMVLLDFTCETDTKVWLNLQNISSIYEIAKPTEKARTTITMNGSNGGYVLSDPFDEVMKRIAEACEP